MTITELTKLWFDDNPRINREIIFVSGEKYGINQGTNFKVRLLEDLKIVSVGVGPTIDSAFHDAFYSLPDKKKHNIKLI